MNELTKLFHNFIQYFFNDPMRLISLIGGAGGIVYWYDRYSNRRRLRIKILNYGLIGQPGEKICIRFEAENIGNSTMSIEDSVQVKGYLPSGMRRFWSKLPEKSTYNYRITLLDRNLPPHVPKVLEAYDDHNNANRVFLWFITYTFKPTRGKKKKIRIRNASEVHLSPARFTLELFLRIFFNRLYSDDL